MANPTYVLTQQGGDDPFEARYLTGGLGIVVNDSGPSLPVTVAATQMLGSIEAIESTGFLVRLNNDTATTRTLTSDGSINITSGDGQGGNTVLSVQDDTSVQKIGFLYQNTFVAARPGINFIPGPGAGITMSDNGGNNVIDVTITASGGGGGGGGAPTDAAYLVGQSNAELPNAINLGVISPKSGLLSIVNDGTAVQSASIVQFSDGQETGSSFYLGYDLTGAYGVENLKNLAIGNNVMNSGSSVQRSIGIGWDCLNAGNECFAFGNEALALNTGTGNGAVGYRALYNNTTAQFNIGIGSYALYGTTTASRKIAIGHRSSYNSLSSNPDTISIGVQSLERGGGADCIAIGSLSQLLNDESTEIVSVGNNTLVQLNDPSSNSITAIGHRSGLELTYGSGETYIGHRAGSTLNSGFDNLIAGANAGAGAENIGQCVILGKGATVNDGVLNAITIGFESIAKGEGQCVLGVSNTKSHTVGIGSSDPQYALHIDNENALEPAIYLQDDASLPPAPATGAILKSDNGLLSVTSSFANQGGGYLQGFRIGTADANCGFAQINFGESFVEVETTAADADALEIVILVSLAGPVSSTYKEVYIQRTANEPKFSIRTVDGLTVPSSSQIYSWMIIKPQTFI